MRLSDIPLASVRYVSWELFYDTFDAMNKAVRRLEAIEDRRHMVPVTVSGNMVRKSFSHWGIHYCG